jgi:hypothetical protein
VCWHCSWLEMRRATKWPAGSGSDSDSVAAGPDQSTATATAEPDCAPTNPSRTIYNYNRPPRTLWL